MVYYMVYLTEHQLTFLPSYYIIEIRKLATVLQSEMMDPKLSKLILNSKGPGTSISTIFIKMCDYNFLYYIECKNIHGVLYQEQFTIYKQPILCRFDFIFYTSLIHVLELSSVF